MSYPSKNASNPTFDGKNTSSFSLPSQTDIAFALLKQDGGYLLQQDGFKILITSDPLTWSYQGKN